MTQQKFRFGGKRRYTNLDVKCDCMFTVCGTSEQNKGSGVLLSCYGNYKCGCSAGIYSPGIFAQRGNDKGGGEELCETQSHCRKRTQCVL